MQILLVGIDRENLPIGASPADQLLFADDPPEALDFLSHIEIDAIVLDCSRISDRELEGSVRALKAKADCPIAALVRDERRGSKVLSAGAQDFLISDLVSEDLLHRVLRHTSALPTTSRSAEALNAEIERLDSSDNPFSSFFIHSPVGMAVTCTLRSPN